MQEVMNFFNRGHERYSAEARTATQTAFVNNVDKTGAQLARRKATPSDTLEQTYSDEPMARADSSQE
jgi:hypothetical protein